VTIDDRVLDEQLHGLIQDIEQGHVRRVAFIAPSPMPWPLPIYELALLTARRAYDMNVELHVTIATPEDTPLAVFGQNVSDAVRGLLSEHGVDVITSAYCEVPEPGHVSIHPHNRTLLADRIVALPQLIGPAARGVPGGAAGGFIPIDPQCKVRGIERVYAAGDATDFAVKHGGIAAQQAGAAAEAIAALAGAPIEPKRLAPQLQGILLGGEHPLYLSARITGGHGSRSEVSELPTSSSATKIAARYLGPYLESLDLSASAVH
jgi:sulfide:quinone oxidoreductase